MTWLGWAVGIILLAMVVSAIWGIWGLVKRDLKQRYPKHKSGDKTRHQLWTSKKFKDGAALAAFLNAFVTETVEGYYKGPLVDHRGDPQMLIAAHADGSITAVYMRSFFRDG